MQDRLFSFISRLLFLSVCLCPLTGQAASGGQLDVSFDGEGQRMITIAGHSVQCSAFLPLPDGKMLAAGVGWAGGSQYSVFLTQLLASGATDLDFGTNGLVTIQVSPNPTAPKVVALRRTSTDDLLIAFSSGNNAIVRRIGATGEVDANFQIVYSAGVDTRLHDMVVLPNDGVVLCGAVKESLGGINDDGWLARFGPSGLLDSSFGTVGKVTIGGVNNNDLRSLHVLADGSVYAGGYGTSGGIGGTGARIWKVAQNGKQFSNLPEAISSLGFSGCAVTRILLDEDSRLVAAAETLSTGRMAFIVRYDGSGALDGDFGVGGVLATPWWRGLTTGFQLGGLICQSDNKLVLGGAGVDSSGNKTFTAMRFTWNGAMDVSYGTDGMVNFAAAESATGLEVLGMQAAGEDRVMLHGGAASDSPFQSMIFARLLPGSLQTPPDVVFDTQPQSWTGAIGQQITLTAEADTVPSGGILTYQWYRNGVRVMGANGSTLAIVTSLFSEGDYTVRASTGASFAWSEAAVIRVIAPPAFQHPHPPAIEFLGLNCGRRMPIGVRGRGGMIAHLYVEGERVGSFPTSGPAPFVVQVEFPDMPLGSRKPYYVELVNADGTATSAVGEVVMETDPYIQFRKSTTLLQLGSTDELPVFALRSAHNLSRMEWFSLGGGDVNVRWFQNGKRIIQRLNDSDPGLPYIEQVTPAHAGRWTVSVATLRGKATSNTMQVVVYDSAPEERLFRLGTRVVLQAKVHGTGVGYQWLKDGLPLVGDTRIKGVTEKTLELNGGSEIDAGQYVCRITTPEGDEAETGSITVHFTSRVPRIDTAVLPAGQVGIPYAADIAVSERIERFTISGLPKGLSMHPTTGRISGTPIAAGNFVLRLAALNPSGRSQTVALPLTIQPLAEDSVAEYVGLISLGFSECLLKIKVSESGGCSGLLDFSRHDGRREQVRFRAQFEQRVDEDGNLYEERLVASAQLRFRHPQMKGENGLRLVLDDGAAGSPPTIHVNFESNDYEGSFSADALLEKRLSPQQMLPKAGWVGYYNLAAESVHSPYEASGQSFVRLGIERQGRVSFAGLLANGRPIHGTWHLLENGTVICHHWLPGFRGGVTGKLTVTEGAIAPYWDSNVHGRLEWSDFSRTGDQFSHYGGTHSFLWDLTSEWGAKYLPATNEELGSGLPLNAPASAPVAIISFLDKSEWQNRAWVQLRADHTARQIPYPIDDDEMESPTFSRFDVNSWRFNPRTGLFSGAIQQVRFREDPDDEENSSMRRVVTAYRARGLICRQPNQLVGKGLGFILHRSQILVFDQDLGRPVTQRQLHSYPLKIERTID
jgi:uncharacterized delta-60 repeat protein